MKVNHSLVLAIIAGQNTQMISERVFTEINKLGMPALELTEFKEIRVQLPSFKEPGSHKAQWKSEVPRHRRKK